VLVEDSAGHEISRRAEAACLSQYLAHHATVIALLRHRGVRIVGFLAGNGQGAAFFANALQAPALVARRDARVVAMAPSAIARVTGLDAKALAERIEDDALVGHPARHLARCGGVTAWVDDARSATLVAAIDALPG